METPTRRRRALSTVLALFLAIESVSAVAAVAVVDRGSDAGARHALPAAAPDGGVLAAQGGTGQDAPARLSVVRVALSATGRRPTGLSDSPDAGTSGATVATSPAPVAVAQRTSRLAISPVKNQSKATGSKSSGSTTSGPRSYKGRNHVWIPALGINRSVSWFPCDRERAPDNYVYRWGCAGRNNVYLLGHAHSVFKPLHDAYVSGRLKVGMKAIYADAKGKVHTYKVRWWKLTRPTTSASWAWAAQSVPSMTLQTCVGKNSEYRLMVRLVEVR